MVKYRCALLAETKADVSRNSESSEQWQQDAEQPRLHRIDIGQGLPLTDDSTFSPDLSDEIITTDLNRYAKIHHPRLAKQTDQYHWNHEAAYLDPKLDRDSGKQPRHWQTAVSEKEMKQRENEATLIFKDSAREQFGGFTEKQRGKTDFKSADTE